MGFQTYRNTNTGLSESNYGYRLALKEERIRNNEKDNEVYIRLCSCCFYHNRCVVGKFCICVRLQNNKLISKDISDYDYFRWKEGLICFNNESVATIIEKLKLYYDIDIEVYNQKFINSRYTGKFRTKDGIEQVLRVLQIEHKFTYTKNNDLNLITIK